MDIKLNENERIDNLEYKNLKIVQDKDGFCFGIDSVLLSDFAKEIRSKSIVLDLGTGNGVLGILLCGKTNLSKIYGVEIQEDIANIAQKSINLNKLNNRFEIINDNIKNLNSYFKNDSIDAIISNPPYKKDNSGLKNESQKKLIARHEITANLEDFISVSSKLLKSNGSLYMVHRPERLADLFYLLKKYKLEPKKLRFVQSFTNSKSKFFLIKATKNANSFLNVEQPLIIYNSDCSYTDEILKIYNKI